MKNREVADKMGLRRENRTGSLKCHPRQGEAARPTESPMFSEGSGSEAAGGRGGGGHAEMASGRITEYDASHVDST